MNGDRVLDLGSGSGRDVRYFLHEGLRAFGADLSIGMILAAKKRGEADYVQMDMARLGFKPESFHGIWCWASLLHLQKKQVPQALNEMSRVLMPGGLLLVALKEGNGESYTDSSSMPGIRRFYSFFRQEEAEQLLEDAGFMLVSASMEKHDSTGWLYIYMRKP